LKKSPERGRTIVFIDESGLSGQPHRVRTWAPIGQTPILEFSFNWQKLSAIAGLTSRSFCFRLYGGAIRTAKVIAFLGQLRRFLPGKLLIIRDRAQIHRGLRVRRYMETHHERLAMTYLPAYAPELNPVEYLWACWRQHELANFCPKDMATRPLRLPGTQANPPPAKPATPDRSLLGTSRAFLSWLSLR
jgi:transposase